MLHLRDALGRAGYPRELPLEAPPLGVHAREPRSEVGLAEDAVRREVEEPLALGVELGDALGEGALGGGGVPHARACSRTASTTSEGPRRSRRGPSGGP